MESNFTETRQSAQPGSERELIESLQRRMDALEQREAKRKVRKIVICSVLLAVLVLLIVIAAPRVTAAMRTLDELSTTAQRYSAQLEELDPDKLQEVIAFINGVDSDTLQKAAEALKDVDLDAMIALLDRMESVEDDRSELKTAIDSLGAAISDLFKGNPQK